MGNKEQLLGFLGIMTRAKTIAYGVKLIEAIRAKKIYVVIISEDIGASNFKKIVDKCKSYDVTWYQICSKKELSNAIGKEMCSAVGIISLQGALKIKNIMKVGD